MFHAEISRGITANHAEEPDGPEILRGLKLHTKTTWHRFTQLGHPQHQRWSRQQANHESGTTRPGEVLRGTPNGAERLP